MQIFTGYLLLSLLFLACGQTNYSANSSQETDSAITIPVKNAPGSLEIADFNNDGFIDIVVAGETDSSVSILSGNGKGNFSPPKYFSAGAYPNDLAIGDVNKDGNKDIAVANHEKNHFTLLLGNGKGDFVNAPGSPYATAGIPHVHGAALADLNNDGHADFLTDSWGNDQVEIVFGDAQSLFKSQRLFLKTGKRPYQRPRAADVNRDGIADIITTNTESNDATILLSDGKGNFSQPAGSPFAAGDNPFGVAVGDVNNDGYADLVVINSPASMAEGKGVNGLTVLKGNGKGEFSRMEGSPFEAGKRPSRVAIGDFNGDGVNDIAASDNGTDKVFIYLMQKTGKPLTRIITVGKEPKGIAAGDFNRDGKADIAVANNAEATISIILSK